MKKFFLVCPIGFEQILTDELMYKWDMAFPNSDCTIFEGIKGGVEIECSLEEGLCLNYILKVPSKILLRVKSQKCRDLPKLYNIIKKINWKDYFQQENIEIKATAKKSRLIHTNRIIESVQGGLHDYFKANKLAEKVKEMNKEFPAQCIFVRLDNDDLSISIDTSGELMHIRSEREFRGHASIRENIAAALLIKLLGLKQKRNITLIDPMCGTGTFLFEALNFHKMNNREFTFQYWANSPGLDKNEIKIKSPWTFAGLFGFDIDPSIIEANKKLNSSVKFKSLSIFDHIPSDYDKDTYLITNPPYGKRVKIEGNKKEYFQALTTCDLISQVPKSQRAFIIPTPFENGLKGSKFYFNQNGIKVSFVSF